MKRVLCVVALVALTGCPKRNLGGVALDASNPPGSEVLKSELGLEDIPYIQNDTYIGNPSALIGEVIEVRSTSAGGKCPESWTQGTVEFSAKPVTGFKVDPRSVLNAPVKRGSKLISKEAAANIAFLSYLSANLSNKTVISGILFDQAAARVDSRDKSWSEALTAWSTANDAVIKDSDVCYLAVVRGFIQKNLVRRTFTETSAETKAAYGVNVDGKYMAANEDYEVDVRFGLSVGILKRPSTQLAAFDGDAPVTDSVPSDAEKQAMSALRSIKRRN